jgi:hypothetical protein
LDGQITQYLGELTGGELARSTRAGGVVGQAAHLSLFVYLWLNGSALDGRYRITFP